MSIYRNYLLPPPRDPPPDDPPRDPPPFEPPPPPPDLDGDEKLLLGLLEGVE